MRIVYKETVFELRRGSKQGQVLVILRASYIVQWMYVETQVQTHITLHNYTHGNNLISIYIPIFTPVDKVTSTDFKKNTNFTILRTQL